MMFRRRKPLPLLQRIRGHIWPKTGLRRSWRYLAHRALRIRDTSYRIAAGVACGIAITFTPFIGFHFVLAALLAWLIGGNIIASALGTLIGNPLTLSFVLWWSYEVGHWIMGGRMVKSFPEDITYHYLLHHPMSVLLPMTIGSIPNAIVAWVITFWPTKILVARYQKLRQQKRKAGAQVRKATAQARSS